MIGEKKKKEGCGYVFIKNNNANKYGDRNASSRDKRAGYKGVSGGPALSPCVPRQLACALQRCPHSAKGAALRSTATSILLPKLAVSAKLLICLLMVVCSESVPPVARSVTLYNQCSCSMLRVNRTGAVAADNSEDGYEKLIIQSRDYTGKLLIYGEKSRRYLCFNPRWKLVGSKKVRGRQCYFREEMVVGGYYRYRSTLDRDKYLGFLSSGRQLRGRKPPNPNCLNWVKIDLGFSIGAHNEEISKGSSKVSLEMLADRRVRHSGKHRLHMG